MADKRTAILLPASAAPLTLSNYVKLGTNLSGRDKLMRLVSSCISSIPSTSRSPSSRRRTKREWKSRHSILERQARPLTATLLMLTVD